MGVSMKLNMMFYVHKCLIENNVFAQILYDHVQYDKIGKKYQNIMFVIGMRSTCMIMLSFSISQLKVKLIYKSFRY